MIRNRRRARQTCSTEGPWTGNCSRSNQMHAGSLGSAKAGKGLGVDREAEVGQV